MAEIAARAKVRLMVVLMAGGPFRIYGQGRPAFLGGPPNGCRLTSGAGGGGGRVALGQRVESPESNPPPWDGSWPAAPPALPGSFWFSPQSSPLPKRRQFGCETAGRSPCPQRTCSCRWQRTDPPAD